MGIDKALEKRRKMNAIQEENITHRAILEPELTKAKKEKPARKRVSNGIRNTSKR